MAIYRVIALIAAFSTASGFVAPASSAVVRSVGPMAASPTMAFGAARPPPGGKKGGKKVVKKVQPKRKAGRKASKKSGGSYTFFSATELSGKLLQ